MNRRSFVKGAAVATAGVTLGPPPVLGGQGYTAPSDELTKAIIGVGGMGQGHIRYEGSRLLAVCDIDIVHIATPLRWHGLMAIGLDLRLIRGLVLRIRISRFLSGHH